MEQVRKIWKPWVGQVFLAGLFFMEKLWTKTYPLFSHLITICLRSTVKNPSTGAPGRSATCHLTDFNETRPV